MSEAAPYRRRSARVLLLDGAGQILLLRYLLDAGDPHRGYGWSTPGGGVNPGEALEQAAARELREEIGLAVAAGDLGRPVAYSSGYVESDWATGVLRDDFFYHRIDRHQVDTSRMEELERSHYTGHRWWAVSDLVATTDIVYPLGLAGLLTDLLAGRIPGQPIRLPWR
jgi:8-oxo-dGTP pyrophosphatase MutT (NUDIX family)